MWAVFLAFVASRAYIPSVGILDTSAETFVIWAKPEQALAFRGFTGHSGKIFSKKTCKFSRNPRRPYFDIGKNIPESTG